ncbi:efflux RND transporter periplasmic adaptor subunit [Breoghania sp.]|uniref:efflux RND transporter periplasmic adaptor subunit n=1 Tax=Breoghania sp. TaxID=2065378 RepID=UPI002AAB93FB|nr:efflux RND transporter periplasmic adaptor subunit [Breoghania sp.]
MTPRAFLRPLLLLALAFGCGTGGAASDDAGGALPSGLQRLEIRAQLLPRRFTTLAAEIGAKISRLPIPEGGRFEAGELLVGFDCALPQAMLQKAQAELTAAQRTYEANRRLAELNSIGLIEVEQSAAAVAKFTADMRAQEVVLSKCSVTAPFGGRVAEQMVREQQYVQPGQTLLDILDDSSLELEFLVPSSWLAWLKVGQSFEVEIDETQATYPARFVRIGARVDPVSQSIKVAATIDGEFPELIAGMSGRIHVSPP